RTNAVRDQGAESGLFRAAMDKIRGSHSLGQSLRTAALAAGLMSDAQCYAELLAQFYLATAALEARLAATQPATAPMAAAVRAACGYSFTEGYEADLASLLGPEWRKAVAERLTTEPARRYVARLERAGDAELAAAAFILWGPLAIGGGAALKPRVRNAFGEDATHVFRSVTEGGSEGRTRRRDVFIAAYDALAGIDTPAFEEVTTHVGELMQLNNEMMIACRQRPWWSKYLRGGAALVV
ncbi:hypothetical protein T484DRAFT_1596778, partial [Baffinella frigidus]